MKFSSPTVSAPAPVVPEPVRIPSPEDPDMLAAKRRREQEFTQREGRKSTDLTSGSSSMREYSRTTLG